MKPNSHTVYMSVRSNHHSPWYVLNIVFLKILGLFYDHRASTQPSEKDNWKKNYFGRKFEAETFELL